MEGFFEETESLCPECLSRIPAGKLVEGGDVYLEKACPDHGNFKVLIWRGDKLYREWGTGEVNSKLIKKRFTSIERGCPYDCGLCPNHEGETCTVLMEVTSRCDIACPICFASANKDSEHDPDLNEIREMYQAVLEVSGLCPLQLSGGEPGIRDDLPDIIALGKKMGFGHIQINTHGLRIAKDKEYLHRLKEAGADLIYLQFDGVSNDVYRHTRGASLFELKAQAINNCAEVKIGTMLVPTLIPNVNDHQIGDIVRFAKRWIPVVKGIHFQPISFFGRYPKSPRNEDRITIPDVLEALEVQTAGEVKVKDFVPRRRKDSHCGFSAFYVLMENGTLQATTNFELRQNPLSGSGCVKESPAEHVRSFISERGRFVEKQGGRGQAQLGSWESFFERAETHYLSISGMPFQDAWTVDLKRLQGCCIHVVTRYKQLVPFCAFYLTSASGGRLQQIGKVSS